MQGGRRSFSKALGVRCVGRSACWKVGSGGTKACACCRPCSSTTPGALLLVLVVTPLLLADERNREELLPSLCMSAALPGTVSVCLVYAVLV